MSLLRLNSRKLYGFVTILTILASVFVTALNIQPTLGAWWNYDWTYRKKITIDHTKVAADLTGFPVLVETTDSDLASHAQNDGDDIAFVDGSGGQLAHEIEFYGGGSGHLVAWVRVPSLSSTVDTVLYMYYGKSDAPSQENASLLGATGLRITALFKVSRARLMALTSLMVVMTMLRLRGM